MKRVIFLTSVVCICLLPACREMETGSGPAPKALEKCTIEPISGGAIIYYTIPGDRNIKYVMAEYERNGKKYVERSSIHNNWLTVEGFNTTNPVKAKLYTVSKTEVRSDSALTVSFIPKESHISMAFKTLRLEPGYGGLLVSWENLAKTELGVRLMIDSVDSRDKIHKVEKEMYFSQLASENRTFRDYDTISYTFGVSFTDKWDNISDTMSVTCRPYYETAVPKPYLDLRSAARFDNTVNNPSLTFAKICDNVTLDRPEVEGRDGGNSLRCTSNSAAQACITFDLQRVYKLSRMKMWPRTRSILPDRPKETIFGDIYGVNNVLSFEMWGTKLPLNEWSSERGYWLDEFSLLSPTFNPGGAEITDPNFQTDIGADGKNVWTWLGYYEVPRYDKLGYPWDMIYEKRNEGWEFNLRFEAEPVRYIRFFARSTIAVGSPPPPEADFQICELSFWGDDLVPQK